MTTVKILSLCKKRSSYEVSVWCETNSSRRTIKPKVHSMTMRVIHV